MEISLREMPGLVMLVTALAFSTHALQNFVTVNAFRTQMYHVLNEQRLICFTH